MKNKILRIVGIILIVIILILMTLYMVDHIRMKNNQPVIFSTWGKKYAPPEERVTANTDINVVLTTEDTITANTTWCGTFQLIWNDLKNDLAKQDIVFTPQPEVVKSLNRGLFNTSKISDDSYYKVYGNPTLELKEKIEKDIKEKFNETSDILNDFNWGGTEKDYFLYTMLKKEFNFSSEFTELENGKFGSYENIQYFGIDDTTKEEVRWQVRVLYYHSKEDFAVKLSTKENDEIILTRGEEGNSFGAIYENVLEESKKYQGNTAFGKDDTLKVPNIKFKIKEEFEELENKPFKFANGDDYYIETAVQTIEFELDKKGGKIKSEAGMMTRNMSILAKEEEAREFLLDDTFTIFLQERGKDMPYFAAHISDITKFQ